MLAKDLEKLVEITNPFAVNVVIQGEQFLKIDQNLDINEVVEHINRQ